MKRLPLIGLLVAAMGAAATAVGITAAWPRAGGEPREPRDSLLAHAGVLLYPAADSVRPPRAMLVFFGNDIGFWAPHRALAWKLSRENIAVVGVDLRRALRALPPSGVAREHALRLRISRIIARARGELGAQCSAILVGGHSLGAEIAVWYAQGTAEITGVLAMSPGARSHLEITISDLANINPTGPESFAVADAMSQVPPHVRIAIVRASKDRYRAADSLLLARGGERTARFTVPLAGHSLKSGPLTYLQVSRALSWLCGDQRCGSAWLGAASSRLGTCDSQIQSSCFDVRRNLEVRRQAREDKGVV